MNPTYTMLGSESEYRRACDEVLARADREIVIFDRDLVALRLEEKARLKALADFLQADSLRRIRVVLHDPAPVERDAPRLMGFVSRFSHVVEVRQSPDNLRHLADAHLFADDRHGVRRFHADHARSALILDDHAYIHPWLQRFEELWALSHSCLRTSTTGL